MGAVGIVMDEDMTAAGERNVTNIRKSHDANDDDDDTGVHGGEGGR